MAKQNIAAMEEAEVNYIVTACPTCMDSLKHDFVKLLKNDSVWRPRAEKFAEKIKDYSELINELPPQGDSNLDSKEILKVTYHDSCHYNRTLGLADKPRNLLNKQKSVELVEMSESDRCCGFGGSYSVKFPEISAEIMKRKLKNIEASGADIVAMDCPGCMIQLKGGLDKTGSQVKVMHTAEILAGKAHNE